MKAFSETFRGALREDRQLNAIISYKTDKAFYVLTTQDDKDLLTENDDILITQQGFLEYDKETINSVNPLFNANLFKTTCKSVQVDTINKIEKGTWINIKIGVYKPNEDKYEYLDYGDYLVNEEPIYQADSNSYLVTAYDKMIESMISYDDNPLSITFPIKHKDFVIAICNKFDWNYDLIDYPNANKNIVQDFYKEQNLTYRDVLDDLNGTCGGSFMFDLKNKLIWKRPTETNQIVEDDDLKDVNVDFAEKYGKVNVLTITTNGNVVLDSKEDTQSIQENGRNEFNVNDNYILNYSTEDFIDEMFDEVNGLEYYLYDVDSTGLLIFDPLDIFTFRHNGIDYKTIMFNDDVKLTQGLVETTFNEKPEQAEKDYKTTDKDKNKLNNALISLDKANAEIQLKVNKGDVVSEINLSPEVVELKGNRVVIDSTYFKVDETGKIIATSCEIGGFNTNDKSFSKNVSGIYDYNLFDTNLIASYIMDELPLDNNLENILDADNNGVVNAVDYRKIKDIIDGKTTNTKNVEGSFEINSTNPKNCISIKDKNNNIVSSLGMGGINTTYLTCNNIICGYPSNSFNDFIRATINGETGKITCVSLEQTSLKENKKNFERYNGALEEIKNIDIYKYNFKNENDEDKKHLGFVIGDDFNYSQLITSSQNDGVDNYSFTSLCLQAIKEQQTQIENLQNQINELKEMIKNG